MGEQTDKSLEKDFGPDGVFSVSSDPELTAKVQQSIQSENWTEVEQKNRGNLKANMLCNMQADHPTNRQFVPVPEFYSDSSWYQADMDHIREYQIISNKIPRETRFYWIKRIINKCMRVSSRYQEMFNGFVTQIVEKLAEKLTDSQRSIQDLGTGANQQFERMQSELDAQRALMRTMQIHFDDKWMDIREYAAGLEKKIVQLNEQNGRIAECEARIAEVESKLQNIWKIDHIAGLESRLTFVAQKVDEVDQIWSKVKEIESGLQNIWATEYMTELGSKLTFMAQKIEGIEFLQSRIKDIESEIQDVWKTEGRMNENLGSIWQTYATFRQEIFYEIDQRIRESSAIQPAANNKQPDAPIIRDSAKEKIEHSDGAIRLNLGSGGLFVEGYLSVDARSLPGVDVIADVSQLPYAEETVDEIFSAHLIEHFTQMKMENELLPYWYSLLKKGGKIRIIFPDLEAMLQAYQQGQMSFEVLGRNIMGGQDYQLDYHYAVYSPETVVALLEKAGFRNVQIVARGRENGGCKETEIIAIK